MHVFLYIFYAIFAIGMSALIAGVIVIFFVQKKEIVKDNNGIFLIDIDLKNNRLRKSDIIEAIDREDSKNNGHEFFDDG
jgi:hypothetical protein